MPHEITRRNALRAGLGLAGALSSCKRRKAAGPLPRVSIVRCSYDQGLFDMVRRVLKEHALPVRGRRVLLKPNLVEYDATTAINTHPLVVAAVLEACRSMGAAAVIIAEGPGHRRATLDLAEAAGYFELIPDFEKIFVDLNLDEVSEVTLPVPAPGLKRLWLPRTALASDVVISLPKMKTHHWVGVTLSMKNLFGLVPGHIYGWPKNILHWAGINECILAINSVFPNVFAVVDGIEGMEGNGPIQGTRKHAGVIVAGADRVAVDATCCRIMGIDPARITYLRRAARRGQTQAQNVTQIGEPIEAVKTSFQLIPQFRHLKLST